MSGRGAPMDDLVPRTPARAPGRGDQAPPPRLRRALYAIVTTLVVLTVVAYGIVYFTRGNTTTKTVTSSTPVVLPKSDPILSRATDPKPLTASEVFGQATIRSSATGGNYTVSQGQTITGCGTVATSKIAAMLSSLGCSQVVRADLTSPDGTYVITAGIVNLPDQASASTARTSIKSLIESGTDHFNAYTLALASPPPTQPTTHLGWDTRGHYLFYVVIGLANGRSIGVNDERTPLIISDIIEKYLSTTVIGAREKTT